jgi:hypothetical protein
MVLLVVVILYAIQNTEWTGILKALKEMLRGNTIQEPDLISLYLSQERFIYLLFT